MAVGGAPVKDALHAARTCDMALDMIDAIQGLTDPSTGIIRANQNDVEKKRSSL